jgi:hypothetical protein
MQAVIFGAPGGQPAKTPQIGASAPEAVDKPVGAVPQVAPESDKTSQMPGGDDSNVPVGASAPAMDGFSDQEGPISHAAPEIGPALSGSVGTPGGQSIED